MQISWQPLTQSLAKQMPDQLRPWLLESYILTQHLQAVGDWKLEVIQPWRCHDNTQEWQRRIVHHVNQQPVVYAEVIMPAATYERYKPHFGELGDKPLGETLLYHNAGVRRSPFEYAQLKAGDELYEKARLPLSHKGRGGERNENLSLWARKSTFYWQDLPIIVIEVFSLEIPAFNTLPKWRSCMRTLRHQLMDYAYLIRLHRPIPILLILWPTLWGLWIASGGLPSLKYFIIFVLGVFVMRSAGDIVNDLADRKLDGFVERTKMRPLATGRVSVKGALILTGILCLIALGLVLMLNWFCLILAFVGLGLTILYPFMKRVTHFPQIVLGLAFNWGIIMTFAAVQNHIPWQAWYLWMISVLWTVAYDSMYALADVKDDVKIGIKSTAVFFGKYYHAWIGGLQVLVIIGLILFGILQHYGLWYFVGVVASIPFFIYQHGLLKGLNIQRCIQAFNNNHWVGLLVWLGVVSTF